MNGQVIPVLYTHQWVGTESHQVDLLLDAACLTEFLSAPYVQEKEEKREAKKVIEVLAAQHGPQHSHNSSALKLSHRTWKGIQLAKD